MKRDQAVDTLNQILGYLPSNEELQQTYPFLVSPFDDYMHDRMGLREFTEEAIKLLMFSDSKLYKAIK